MIEVACIGFLNLEDTVYPSRQVVERAEGGAALYFSTAAALWGARVTLISRIGEDYPKSNLKRMRKAGLNIEYVKTIPGKTMAGRTIYDQDGGRTYKMYTSRERRMALTPMPGDWLVDPTAPPPMVHVSTMPPDSQIPWLETLKPEVSWVSLDTDISFVQQQREPVMQAFRLADICFLNRQEAEALFPSVGLHSLIRMIAALGPSVVALKQGGDGALIYDARVDTILHIAAVPANVLDVTGAGDAFAAGFKVGFAETKDIREAGRRGSVTASMAIEGFGAMEILDRTREEALARYQTCFT